MDTIGRGRLFKADQPNLPIRVQLQKMYARYLREVVQYPKIYKPTIGQDMRESFMELRSRLNYAAKVYKKQTALREADTALDNLRDAVWAAYEVKCISDGQYGLWIEELNTLGKMLGGWIKSVKENERSP